MEGAFFMELAANLLSELALCFPGQLFLLICSFLVRSPRGISKEPPVRGQVTAVDEPKTQKLKANDHHAENPWKMNTNRLS